MSAMTPKELKAMAKACREAGILTFKGNGVEFTLAPEAPRKAVTAKTAPQPLVSASDDKIETDTPDFNSLLFWSTSDEATEQKAES